jgi:hypothetical protein
VYAMPHSINGHSSSEASPSLATKGSLVMAASSIWQTHRQEMNPAAGTVSGTWRPATLQLVASRRRCMAAAAAIRSPFP